VNKKRVLSVLFILFIASPDWVGAQLVQPGDRIEYYIRVLQSRGVIPESHSWLIRPIDHPPQVLTNSTYRFAGAESDFLLIPVLSQGKHVNIWSLDPVLFNTYN
jgi:hypothetical protein